MAFFEETLRGEVLRVVFENRENAFAVLKIRPEGGKKSEELAVVGDLAGIPAGATVEFTGTYEYHSGFGRRFRAKKYRETVPATTDGLIRFLGSGVIPGVGMKLAKVLVDYFGPQTIDVLNNSSKRLLEVPKIGRKKAEAIRKAWHESAARRECFIFLQGLGISPLLSNKLYEQYGDRTAELIRTNPYRLADEVRGIGFLRADEIAANAGIPKDSPERICAGAAYVMNTLIGAGNCCYPEEDFIDKCVQLLEQPGELVRAGVKLACQRNLLKNFEGFIYTLPLLRAELNLANSIARLAGCRSFAGSRLPQSNIAGADKNASAVSLSDEQKNAVENIRRSPLNIITGGPGVGKTTVVSEIVRRAKRLGMKIMLAAPTGRAAKRLSETTGCEAKTLHRLLLYDPAKNCFYHDESTPLNADMIILDEVSMLDTLLADAFFRAVKNGTSVILLGDPDQLPSVGAGCVLNSFMECGFFQVSALRKVFRQGAGSSIIAGANAVNRGFLPQTPAGGGSQNGLSDFYWIKQGDPEKVLSLIDRLLLERIPERFHFDQVSDVQILVPMNKGNCGCLAVNEHLQTLLNGGEVPSFQHGTVTFKTGDKVMQTSNDYEKNVFNGDMGRISVIMHHERKFMVDFGYGNTVEYDFDDADGLTLAYAVTVHKSQGSEFPVVIMPLLSQHYMMLQRKLLYTAMTRARKLLVLIGDENTVKMAAGNNRSEIRYSKLTDFLKRQLKKT